MKALLRTAIGKKCRPGRDWTQRGRTGARELSGATMRGIVRLRDCECNRG